MYCRCRYISRERLHAVCTIFAFRWNDQETDAAQLPADANNLLDLMESAKRAWKDLPGSGWGKRSWQDLPSSGWGKRGWQDLQTSGWGKRGWQDLQTSGWGKRAWQNLPSSGWGKRTPRAYQVRWLVKQLFSLLINRDSTLKPVYTRRSSLYRTCRSRYVHVVVKVKYVFVESPIVRVCA